MSLGHGKQLELTPFGGFCGDTSPVFKSPGHLLLRDDWVDQCPFCSNVLTTFGWATPPPPSFARPSAHCSICGAYFVFTDDISTETIDEPG